MKRIAILGSTGSIGRSTLAVVDHHADRLRVVALAAGKNVDRLAAQAATYRPALVSIGESDDAAALRGAVPDGTRVTCGAQGLVDVATHPDVDVVLCASSGTAALEAVLAAIEAGKAIALANKEVLVMAGALVTGAARRRGVALLPVDSEHNAIHQCVHGRDPGEIRRLILTASGGPFRTWSADRLETASPGDALRHPTWTMGRKITIDSATLMNKGLEVIEAHWLFGVPAGRIAVVVHPQSIVHSMVELRDGSTIAQLGVTDMRLPIQYALSWPERWEAPTPGLDLLACGPLEFDAPDPARFPCLRLAYDALEAGGTLPVVMNAANEIGVEAFLDGRLSFPGIARVIAGTMAAHDVQEGGTLGEIRVADTWAREHSRRVARDLELKAG